MMRSFFRYVALAGLVGLPACDLAVVNPNDPETERVLASPADVEALLGSQYLRWLGGPYGGTGNVWGMAAVMSHEDFSSLSNNCLGQRVSIPRASNDNSVGNGCGGDQASMYNRMSEVMRTATNVLNKWHDESFTLGSHARDLRARAQGEFLRALSLGYLALIYDSAAVVSEQMSGEDPGELVGYMEVAESAYAALQRAIDYAQTPPNPGSTADGFPLPGTWIPSPTSMTVTEFVKLVRSYRARFRANVARDPTERAAVNWDLVIADAQNGITADHDNNTGSTTGGASKAWVAQWLTFTTWHQMTAFIVGMADGSDGAYAAWTAQPLDSRGSGGAYFQSSPDQRWPQGATRPAQQADFDLSTHCTTAGSICKRYFRNRPTGNDTNSGPSWGWSNFDWVRHYPWRTYGSAPGLTGQQGPLVFFSLTELKLLEAEGHYRKGAYAAAGALVNITRNRCHTTLQAPCPPGSTGGTIVGGGLPAITVFDNVSPVPGGADCVPKKPVNASPAGGGTVTCGDLWEALKYEKRIETMYTHFAGMFFDSRGWGDLAEGTPLDWAAPYQDLLARGRVGVQIYSTGGSGNYHAAATGTYGW